MNLPNAINAYADRSKLIDYLLAFDHPEGGGKAVFFTRFGFTADEWQVLADALIATPNRVPYRERPNPNTALSMESTARFFAQSDVPLPSGPSGSSTPAQTHQDWSRPIRYSMLPT